MTEHTPEPWGAYEEQAHYSTVTVVGDGIDRIATFPPGLQGWANARRAAACVNACAGIPTEALLDTAALAAFFLDRAGSEVPS